MAARPDTPPVELRVTGPQPLIGISGRKRAGKDTLASFLVNDHGFKRLAFADALKAIVAELNPIIEAFNTEAYGEAREWRLGEELRHCKTDTDPTGWEHAKAMPEVRRLLQAHGVAVRNHIGDNVWVDALMRKASWLLAEGQPLVVTDVRFPNEADAIHNKGGIVVRVNRPGTADGTNATDLHISETALDEYEFDLVVDNTGAIDALSGAAAYAVDLMHRSRY